MISHDYRCIFVHIPKNAGQSVENVFLRLTGLSWETRAPLLLRYNNRPDLGPPRLSHLKADEYVRYRYVSQDLFASYFKFAFVRNPWDRMVSMYKYHRFERICTFKRFLEKEFPKDLWKNSHWFVSPQSDYVCDSDGEILVDFVGRYENLQADFLRVCEKLGLPPLEVPHVNHSGTNRAERTVRRELKKVVSYPWWLLHGRANAKKTEYRDYYDARSRELVVDYYHRDIELFAYEF